ncbi:MAG: two-component system histidine kinase PnpS [Nitrospirota bacterium]
MKRILFRRVLFFYLIITPLLIVSLQLYLSSIIKDNYILTLRENLIIQARLIADQIPSSTSNLDDFCKIFKGKTGARVTIIDNAGRVLGDSDEPSHKMENHADRPEIKDAAINGDGSSIRFSKTIKTDLFYLAIPTTKELNGGFVRLSMPLYGVEKAINKIRLRIIAVSLAALIMLIVVALIHTRRITKSIEEITAFSKEVAEGNFRRRLFIEEKGELGELGKNIGDMAQELNIRLTQSEEEKDKMEAILKNMSGGLILADIKGRILLSNSAIKNVFGIEQDIEGKTMMEAFRKAELTNIINKVIENKEPMSQEVNVTYPKEIYLIVNAAPFLVKGKISGAILTFHDITRLKKLEDVRKDFVANVSHEIRTPITAIKGFAETLLEGAIDDKENALKFLETIKNHSDRLNSLVADLLTLSGIELGDIKIEKTIVNLNDLIDTVFATLKEKAHKKGLSLKKDISPEIQEIQADRDRLIQILLNLVDNGIKFTGKGGVTIKAQKVSSQQSVFVEISVEDTGVGIPKKHLSRLGERFYRVDRARSRELGGTGLGLAIVKHLVKAHGWEMSIESEHGEGTKVRLFCPFAIA